MDCNSCKEKRTEVPYLVHESTMARMERANKRLWVIVIILIFALVLSNVGWIMYESQFEDIVTTEIEQDSGDGNNYIVGGDYHGAATYKSDPQTNP